MAKHNDIGRLGEEIAERFLRNKGYFILDKNYKKAFGEIDIIARKKLVNEIISKFKRIYHIIIGEKKLINKLFMARDVIFECSPTYFFEVKSTGVPDLGYRPEEHINKDKIKRQRNIISHYIKKRKIKKWSFGVVIVYLDNDDYNARCRLLSDIFI